MTATEIPLDLLLLFTLISCWVAYISVDVVLQQRRVGIEPTDTSTRDPKRES